MQSLEALKDLQRKYAGLLLHSWPDETVVQSCNTSIEKIKNIFSNNIDDIDFSNTSQRDFLSTILYKYLAKDDNKFTVKLIEQLSAWFTHCYIQKGTDTDDSLKLYQLTDTFILEKIFKLFESPNVNKQLVGNNLMTSYLNLHKNCSPQFIKILMHFVKRNDIVENLDDYFDKNYFIKQIRENEAEKENYTEYLTAKNIKNRFINTKYFSNIWFWWVMKCADVLSENFITNNIVSGLFTKVSLDEQKVILAYMAKQIDSISDNEKRNNYFRNYLIPIIGKHNPIHIEYWKITDNELEAIYGKLLESAPKIFRKYYISEFIIIFFDALESTGGDEDRAIFWRGYKNKINDFAIALKPAHRRPMQNYIVTHVNKEAVNGYLEILSDFTLNLQTTNSNTPAVLVLAFASVIIVEFSEKGNAMYIYRNNDESYPYYLKTDNKNTELDFKNTDSPNYIDKLTHSGKWQANFRYNLSKRFNIVP